MRALSKTPLSKQDIKTRQHLMERSFARGKRYGFDRVRWKNLWRVSIQKYLTAAIQNIQVLIINGKNPIKSISMDVPRVKSSKNLVYRPVYLTNHIARFPFLQKKDIRAYFFCYGINWFLWKMVLGNSPSRFDPMTLEKARRFVSMRKLRLICILLLLFQLFHQHQFF